MAKKKGEKAAKARAKREARNRRSDSPEHSGGGGGDVAFVDESELVIVPPGGKRVNNGLANLGNTCFMNSILQCINVSVPFSDEIIKSSTEGLDGLAGSLCSTLRGMRGLEHSKESQGTNGSFSPKKFREQVVSKFPWYQGKEQQDAHEFLSNLIGGVADETTFAERAKAAEQADGKNQPEADPAACRRCVTGSFRGQFCAATLCWTCARISLRLDAFLDVQLGLPSLASQTVGRLGIRPVAEAEPPVDEAESLSSTTAKSKKSQKAPKEAQPKARAAKGVWGLKQDEAAAEEFRKTVRSYIGRLLVRKLAPKQASLEPGGNDCTGGNDDEQEDDLPTIEVELSRKKNSGPQWGFVWSENMLEEDALVVCNITEDSVLDKYNLRCRAMFENESVICVGDRVVEVNGEKEVEEMTRRLRSDHQVSLRVTRGARGSVSTEALGRGRAESDGETERKAKLAAEARQNFEETASRCQESLPADLLDVFSPGEAAKGTCATSGSKFRLEDCLRQFSVVEALEDDHRPSYRCSVCEKTGIAKTLASRRLWIWPSDLPPLLTLQLKRFRRYGPTRFEKSVASVTLPVHLDMSQHVISEACLETMRRHLSKGQEVFEAMEQCSRARGTGANSYCYELYGICEHQGDSMKRGHYVAYVNSGPSAEAEDWYRISDDKVSRCKRDEVLKAEAYVAFYRCVGSGDLANQAPPGKAKQMEANDDNNEVTCDKETANSEAEEV
eukprot:TRINITY_DN74506_c0_g1_i1.p1 TRINITY_DN74506_c0_g1~~TRINITY_DN74506_c0_g1_i1.p1  ORF type:complete len:729 (+),score=163.68 TRINITY_DN74506_c0_g1_i1:86-2272(+)